MNWLTLFPRLSASDTVSKSPSALASHELSQTFPEKSFRLSVSPVMGDAFTLDVTDEGVSISGGETGLLYGAYHYLRAVLSGTPLSAHTESAPAYPLRMINCWDNMDGSVERGYAGRSLFFEANHFSYDPERITHLGRMMATVGLNVLCLNNVNVHEPAQDLIQSNLPALSAFADLLRPFGVRLMISIDFSQPIRDGLPTADPLEDSVQRWWADTVSKIYEEIPDLAGFLVKADSEGRPGPFSYGRTHADGANMLARALKPHGGVLVWRCFVYNCRQDWRDASVDRPKAAYETYQPLDGLFDDNVILQIKNGPFDFQVREPVSPLLLSLKNTRKALELQLAQEYTGQQIDLYCMPPMWQEVFTDLPINQIQAIAAVSNLGRDENYFGHPLAAVNFFAFGLLSWNPAFDYVSAIKQWVRLTYSFGEPDTQKLSSAILSSRGIYEKYTATLGLGWMVTPHTHYGVDPLGYEFDLWGTYHRANHLAVGIDRTPTGTGYTSQYPEALASRYESLETCPDNLLLFFHRLPYTYRMKDGRTLIQRIYDDHFEGAEEVAQLKDLLASLPFPSPDREVISYRADRQLQNALQWRDVINTFFYRYSMIPDEKSRKIYE